jgi:hypothetical protein
MYRDIEIPDNYDRFCEHEQELERNQRMRKRLAHDYVEYDMEEQEDEEL